LRTRHSGVRAEPPLKNRIRKNYKHLKKWGSRTKTHCFRIYDRDIKEHPLAIDYYDGKFCIHYYSSSRDNDEPPSHQVQACNEALCSIFGVEQDAIFWRSRVRRKKLEQYEKKKYYSSRKDCNTCPFRTNCVDSRGVKMLSHTVYKEEYEQMIKKLKSQKGRSTYLRRMQTVESILGTLQQHYGLRFMNVRGKRNAQKVMLMAGAAINLKKWFKKTIKDTLNGFWTSIMDHFQSQQVSLIFPGFNVPKYLTLHGA